MAGQVGPVNRDGLLSGDDDDAFVLVIIGLLFLGLVFLVKHAVRGLFLGAWWVMAVPVYHVSTRAAIGWDTRHRRDQFSTLRAEIRRL